MSQLLADRTDPRSLAAAMARHPAAGPRPQRVLSAAPSFRALASLLTGPWRVNDPVAFDRAMRRAPLVGGYPVVGLSDCARYPTTGLDPWSAAAAGRLEEAVSEAAGRADLSVRWVAARGGGRLFVEASAEAPAAAGGPELLVLAHLVDDLAPRPGPRRDDDDSWAVFVVGDGRGGVAGVVRAGFSPAGMGGRFALGALRGRLLGPARAVEGVVVPPSETPVLGVVLPFRR